jgi:hypothetical protein
MQCLPDAPSRASAGVNAGYRGPPEQTGVTIVRDATVKAKQRLSAALVLFVFWHGAWACIVDSPRRSETQVLHPTLAGPARPPVFLSDCKGVRLQGAAGTVCGIDSDGDPRCEDLKPGAPFTGWPKRDPTMQTALAVLLEGTLRERTDGQRMNKANVRIPGLPYESIAPPNGTLRLMLTSPIVFGRAGNFVLTAQNQRAPAFSAQIPAGARVLEVPAQILRPGGEFSWTLRVGNETHRGNFNVATDIATLKAELQPVLTATEISEHTRQLWVMMLYDAHGFASDSQRLQLELREGE